MAEKSAIRLIKGDDALFEYELKSYKATTYVERNGLIYKSLIDTSTTFVPTEWELVNDLREVRVANITDRNALTGLTGTSGTTGIRVPILDNTNVLVLNAFDDIGVNQFARYNWNSTTNTWLLLQAGSGTTSGGTIGDYPLLTNKPLIISGITATAGAGLTGGGVFSGAVPPNRASFTFSHLDTSTLANTSNAGFSYIQNVRVDTFGHLTGVTNSTWSHPDTSSQASVSNSQYTYIKDITLDDSGHVTAIGSSTWTHPDTSSQASANNSGSNYIQSVYLDSDGHVTGLTTTPISFPPSGVNFNVGGNVGSLIAMPNNGNLRITGGSNIQTVTSINGLNLGVRVNVVPAGSSNQIQLNSSGVLGTSAQLYFTGTTTNSGSLRLISQPASGSTLHEILVRNATSGRVERFSFNNLPAFLAALPINANQYRTANGFGGDAKWIFDPTTKSLTLGTRTGTVGSGSTTLGFANIASGILSHAEGTSTTASGANSHAEGTSTTASNTNSHAEGLSTTASGIQSHAEGNNNIASGENAHAQGSDNAASGDNSHAGGNLSVASGLYTHASGKGFGGSKNVRATGSGAFIHSTNTTIQVANHGALAPQSAILGGLNHNIEVGNVNAAIIGGSGIKLTASTYSGMTAVAGLAIFATPAAGGGDDLLTWNATDKKINKISQSSLTGIGAPAGANGWIQFRNNSGQFGAAAGLTYLTGTSFLVSTNFRLTTVPTVGGLSDNILVRNTTSGNIETTPTSNITNLLVAGNGLNKQGDVFRLGGALTGDTTISGSFGFNFMNTYVTIGSRGVGTVGSFSLTNGLTNIASGAYSYAQGANSVASGLYSYAQGSVAVASGDVSHAEGVNTIASGAHSHAQGNTTIASGNYSHAGGIGLSTGSKQLLATGGAAFNHSTNGSAQRTLHGALGNQSAILGGENHNISSTSSDSAIIGGTLNKITGATSSVILGGSNITLTGSSQSNHVVVPNLMLWDTPITSTITDDILTWNLNTKKIRKVTQASLFAAGNGLTKQGTVVRLGGTLTGDTIISQTTTSNLSFINSSWTFGTRNTGTVGVRSLTLGTLMIASGTNSFAIGSQSEATANYSIATGLLTLASGVYSFAGGSGYLTGPHKIIAAGTASFNFSINTVGVVAGQGAMAQASTILGGQNHHINNAAINTSILGGDGNKITGATNSAIIGGSGIQLTGTSQNSHVVVPSLIIWTTPTTAAGADNVLGWNSNTRKVRLGTISSTSDIRLKENLIPLTNVVDKISSLNAYEFTFNSVNKENEGVKNYGLTAQDVEKVFPHVVKDNYNFNDVAYKTVDYRHLVPILFTAIKELNDKISELNSKIDQLTEKK